jgi:hypothetical protein
VDIFSHAAWGVAALRAAPATTRSGHSQRRVRWWAAALAGAAPDLLWAIPLVGQRLLGLGTPPPAVSPGEGIWRADGPPLPAYLVEAYYRYYVKSHSLVLLASACAALWLATKSGRVNPRVNLRGNPRMNPPAWLWLAVPYALHIFVDIPTHERYQTQPFWPLSSWHMQGISWSDPRVFFPNLAALAVVYLWLWRTRRL